MQEAFHAPYVCLVGVDRRGGFRRGGRARGARAGGHVADALARHAHCGYQGRRYTGNCQSGPCKTLGYALSQAGPNEKIVILPGTYRESGNANVVSAHLAGLKITSSGSAAHTVIDATGNTNGLLIEASGVSVTGLTVENANLEGILAEPPRSS